MNESGVAQISFGSKTFGTLGGKLQFSEGHSGINIESTSSIDDEAEHVVALRYIKVLDEWSNYIDSEMKVSTTFQETVGPYTTDTVF